jgi:hypothetical protein
MPEAATASRDKTRDGARTAAPAASAPAPGPVIGIGGVRWYRMRNGKWIQLEEDMTAEQAAQLEAEGAAAEKQLGRGPAPRPVPDVKKPPKKDPVKETPKRGRGRPGARGGAAAKAAAAAAALLGAVGSSKVAQFLAAKAVPVLGRGSAMLARLKQNEQTHDDAGEKLKKSEDAVVIPQSDNQSKSNAGQVEAVEARPAPAVDEAKAKTRLQQSLAANIPRKMEDADNFKRDMKAQHMGAEVLEVVQADKNSVVTTFGDMQRTPPPAPPEHTPVELPPAEGAPRTAPMNLGRGAVAPLEKEHTDVGNYTKEADGKLKEEGVTQEQLDMVDSGELAEANKEKKGLETKARTEPLQVQQFARAETERVDKELVQEESAGRAALAARRRGALGATGQKQHGTKSALEKKRDEVAAKINGMYKATQDSVTKKLADLETQSMKRFDAGNAKAAKDFEDNVNREIDAFKEDRYSGWFGWARHARDWLKGIDDLPRVKQIFDTNRAAFVETINKLVESITADNKRVIQECKNELAETRKKIKEYVDGLGPALKDIGKKAAEEMNEKLAALDNTVGAKEEELRGKLKDKQAGAIRAIDDKITKMKESMSGALAKLGRLLLWAAKKFFSWALGKFGVSLGTIESIIDKGVAVLKAIFTGPIKFVKNLVGAAMLGFGNFGKNFLTHLKNAVFEWLTGSLEGVTLPETWNLRGILSVVFQLVGLTWANIRAHLLKLIPEPALKALETGFELVKTLITEGPMAAWEQLKSIGAELQDAFVEAVKNWIKWKIVEEAIKTIVAIFVPGAGIIKAIIAIYDTIVFFIQKAKQIMEMIGSFLGSIADIAAGNIAGAAAALEEGLARALKLVIAFLAKFLHLDGITARIRKLIQDIRGKVDAVIEKVATWIVGMAKKGGRLVAEKAGEVFSWAFAKAGFGDAEGKTHAIYVEGEDSPRLMIASNPKAAEEFLDWYLTRQAAGFRAEHAELIDDIRDRIRFAKGIVGEIASLKKNGAAWKDRQRTLLDANVMLSKLLSTLVGEDPMVGKKVAKYKLEGLTGTYGSIPKPPADDFTPDHQPQAAVLVKAAKFRFFSPDGTLNERAEGRAKEGYAINLYKRRHQLGRTYGMKGKGTKADFFDDLRPLIKDRPASEQRQEVIRLLKAAVRNDAAAIKQVVRAQYDDENTWGDVTKFTGQGKVGQDLVGEIRTRINAGEDQIVNQDLDELTK